MTKQTITFLETEESWTYSPELSQSHPHHPEDWRNEVHHSWIEVNLATIVTQFSQWDVTPPTHTLTHREKQTEINSERQKQTERTHCLLQAQFLNSHICTFFPDSASELRLWEGHPCQGTSQGCCLHENIQLPPAHLVSSVWPSQCKSVRDKTRCSRIWYVLRPVSSQYKSLCVAVNVCVPLLTPKISRQICTLLSSRG